MFYILFCIILLVAPSLTAELNDINEIDSSQAKSKKYNEGNNRKNLLRGNIALMGQVSSTNTKIFFTNSSEEAYMSWIDALEFCQKNGMSLAQIDNEDENTLVNNYLKTTFSSYKFFWLGGTDYGSEGKFYWLGESRNTEFGFSKWAEGYPTGGTKGNCLFLNGDSGGAWFDYPCKYPFLRPLCQFATSVYI